MKSFDFLIVEEVDDFASSAYCWCQEFQKLQTNIVLSPKDLATMYHCYRKKKEKHLHGVISVNPQTHKVLHFTYIGGGSKFVSVLIELPGCCWIHLDQSDTALTPHILGLVNGEEGVHQEVHDAP